MTVGHRLSGAAVLLCWAAIGASAVDRLSAQTVSFTPVGTIAGPADVIEVHGNYAYVAAGGTLTVFDVSNPAAPKRAGAHKFSEKIWGFTVVGPLVYTATDFSGLGILDVSNPAALQLRGSLKTPGQAKNVTVSGTIAAVADHVSGVDLIDVSNPAKPALLGSVYLDGYARDVASLGSLAYAVDNPTGLYVIDLANRTAADPITALQSATAPQVVKVAPGSGSNSRPIAVLVGGGSLQVYDLTNPSQPVKTSTLRTPGGARRVALKGQMAYVADGAEGLQVVDLSNPTQPTIISSYKPASPVRDVAVADSLVFVIVGQLRRITLTPLGASIGPREAPPGDVLILRPSR